MGWKKLSSKLLVRHPRIELHEDIVVLPSGAKSDYVHFGKLNDAVAVIAIGDNDKVFIQKEYSYPPNQWLYQFPGGGVENNEDVKQAASRELAEEGGLGGDLTLIGSFFTNNRRSDQRIHVFVAKNLHKRKAQQDPEEEFEDFWLTSKQIDDLIAEGKLCISSALSAWALYKNSDL